MVKSAFDRSIDGNFKGKDILSINQFSPKDIEKVIQIAGKMKNLVINHKISTLLSGYVISAIFFEPSTRTFSSFTTSAKRLGATTIEHQNPLITSSVAKGETLEDTMKTLQAYSDAIIIRHPESGSAKRAADYVEIPVLNAGDGTNEHPTQTLLDLLTIKEKMGKLENLKIAFIGDQLHSRVLHGQISALSKYKGNKLYGISPNGLELPDDYKTINYQAITIDMKHLDKSLAEIQPDIVSVGIIKKKYTKEDSKKYHFYINSKTLDSLPKKSIIMHCLPRIDELATEVDNDPRAVYFSDQIRNGLYVRMALLALVLGKI
jgi:aspartate carbamoyltransferase catalytic subunit